jgi:hypothetical protein
LQELVASVLTVHKTGVGSGLLWLADTHDLNHGYCTFNSAGEIGNNILNAFLQFVFSVRIITMCLISYYAPHINTAQVHTTLKRKPQSSAYSVYIYIKKQNKQTNRIVCGVNSHTIVVNSGIGSLVIRLRVLQIVHLCVTYQCVNLWSR